MAFGSIEFTTISRAQDYSAIKQNEDNKGMMDQVNFGDQVQKSIEQQTRQVNSSDDTQWHENRPDAKEKGKGQYSGDGGAKRKKNAPSHDRVVVKGIDRFDMKI